MSPSLRFPRPSLHDDVVLLRPWARGDVNELSRICRDPEIPKYTRVPVDYTPEIGAFFVDGSPVRARRGEALELAVVARPDGDIVASVGLHQLDWDGLTGEIGYWTAREARGRGVATRAVKLLSEWVLGADGLGFERLEIAAFVDNEPSQRVALAAGYRALGRRDRYVEHRGVLRDCEVFELRRD